MTDQRLSLKKKKKSVYALSSTQVLLLPVSRNQILFGMWESSEGTRPDFIIKPCLFGQPTLEKGCGRATPTQRQILDAVTLFS